MGFQGEIKHILLNLPGWHTRRHIVVIESDDWGSIRMPSREVYNEFIRNGIRVDRDPYCKYDGIATSEDLSNMFEILDSVHDKNGNPAVLTANSVVANPVFGKIKESGFKEYFYEPFTETIKRSSNHAGVLDLWRQGMREGIFHPQLHGREHLNVKKWLRTLQAGEEVTRFSFDLGTFGLTSAVDSRINNNYMGAFNSGLEEDIEEYSNIITEGQQLFETIFGYKSESFIATTYTWNPKIEIALRKNGIKYLQGLVTQKIPKGDDCEIEYRKKNYQGKRSGEGLIYLMRNVFFEPTHHPNTRYVDECLHRIDLAFRCHKAAVIGAHRVNFIGSIDKSNTDFNLPQFKYLLKEIVRRWSDVEFMTSDQLGHIIDNYDTEL